MISRLPFQKTVSPDEEEEPERGLVTEKGVV